MGPSATPASKLPYDPVQIIEGMFNGSVTRIGYALKDPSDYAPSTKTILAECAKKFQDALDDCEIQLLDAKWYLEHQLRSNQLRREAKAQEMGTAAKRKHDEIKDIGEQDKTEEVAAKKAKVEQSTEQAEPKEPPKLKNPTDEKKPGPTNGTSDVKKPEPQQKPSAENENKGKDKPSTQTVSKPVEQPKPPPKEQPIQDDFAKPTSPQPTPTGTNDYFFESMFGEPTTDMPDDTKDDNDFNFDFTTGDMSLGEDGAGNEDPNSLDSMIPGLAWHANQTDDNQADNSNNTTNNTTTTNTNNNSNNSNNNNNNSNVPDANAQSTFTNDFDLPDIGGPNIFDDLLGNDDMGGGDIGDIFDDNIDLSDSALLDTNFDFIT